jgi:hypothetical protein
MLDAMKGKKRRTVDRGAVYLLPEMYEHMDVRIQAIQGSTPCASVLWKEVYGTAIE